MAEGALGGDKDRLPAAMQTVVNHMRQAVCEIEPSRDELMAAIRWLTETGQISDTKRQEWILLSDVLGVSALVDAINERRETGARAAMALGPFYVPGAPQRRNGDNICATAGGEPVIVEAQVRSSSDAPIAAAKVEVWQANQHGFYENQQPDEQPEHNLRGVFTTDADGRAWWRSVRPGGYPLPTDGPVGMLMKGLGRTLRRPAHLHLMVRAAGFETVTLHIFDADDPMIDDDPLFAVRSGRARQFDRDESSADPLWRLQIPISLSPRRET